MYQERELNTALSQKSALVGFRSREYGEFLDMWHNLWWDSEYPNTHTPFHKLSVLTPPTLPHPTLGRPHLWDSHVRGSWGSGIVHQRPPELLPRLIAETLNQSIARDAKWCCRSTISYKRQCQTCPLPREGTWHSHLAWTYINPLNSMFCRTLSTQKIGRRGSMRMVIFSA